MLKQHKQLTQPKGGDRKGMMMRNLIRHLTGFAALAAVALLAAPSLARAQFTENTPAGLPGATQSSVAWGDYDNDGRLDFIITGNGIGLQLFEGEWVPVIGSQLWRNTGSGFINVTDSVAPGLPAVVIGSVAWGDYDNDGRLDFLITGATLGAPVSQLWRNTGSGFTQVPIAGLPGVRSSSVAWADFNNDGRLDFLLTGQSLGGDVSQLWQNHGDNTFSNVTATAAPGLPGVDSGSVAWGDYDNDGRLDFLITGFSTGGAVSQLWRNNGDGTFSNVTATAAPGLPGVQYGSVAWGDYNNDGHLDFLLTGYHGGPLSQLWRNNGNGTFSDVTASAAPGLPGVSVSSVAWGDYDNDGRLDFFLTGTIPGAASSAIAVSQLWRNTGSGFVNVPLPGVPGVAAGSVAWGDYDNDGDLDLLLTGAGISKIYRNDLPTTVEVLNDLLADVAALKTAGIIKSGTANAMTTTLNQVLNSLNTGKIDAACSQLADFIALVQGQIDSGKLSSANGAPLINSANYLRARLGC